MNERLRVAVVGCGGIGKIHLEAFRELAAQYEIKAICDTDTARVQGMAAEFNVTQVYSDFTSLCERTDLDAISICTPPYLHRNQIEAALRSGKHVICEKPLVGSLLEADELAALEAQTGKRIMPIFQYRFGHGLQKLKLLVEAGLAGRAYLTTIQTTWRRRANYYAVPWRGKWKTELGGALVTQAVHAHDMLTYIVGPVKRVSAYTATRVNAVEVEDCAAVTFEMADGSLATSAVTLGCATEISQHHFCFEGFSALSNTQPYHNSSDPWNFQGDSVEMDERIKQALTRFEPLPEGHVGQFYRFYHALQASQELPITLSDARLSLQLITAIYHSAQTGQSVALPLTATHPKYGGWQP